MTSTELKLAAKVLEYAANQSESSFDLIWDGKLTKKEAQEILQSFSPGEVWYGKIVRDDDLMIWLSKLLLKSAKDSKVWECRSRH